MKKPKITHYKLNGIRDLLRAKGLPSNWKNLADALDKAGIPFNVYPHGTGAIRYYECKAADAWVEEQAAKSISKAPPEASAPGSAALADLEKRIFSKIQSLELFMFNRFHDFSKLAIERDKQLRSEHESLGRFVVAQHATLNAASMRIDFLERVAKQLGHETTILTSDELAASTDPRSV